VFELLGTSTKDGGEWYYDIGKSLLYYTLRQGEDINAAEVILPQTQQLISAVNGLHHVSFTGIIFSYATWLQVFDSILWSIISLTCLLIHDRVMVPMVMLRCKLVSYSSTTTRLAMVINLTTHAPTPPLVIKFFWDETDKLVRPTGGAVVFERSTHHISLHRYTLTSNEWLLNDHSHIDNEYSCTFSRLGGTGLVLSAGSQYINVSNSIFTDISATGLQVGDGQYSHPSLLIPTNVDACCWICYSIRSNGDRCK
jgi:hypothetical protein